MEAKNAPIKAATNKQSSVKSIKIGKPGYKVIFFKYNNRFR